MSEEIKAARKEAVETKANQDKALKELAKDIKSDVEIEEVKYITGNGKKKTKKIQVTKLRHKNGKVYMVKRKLLGVFKG